MIPVAEFDWFPWNVDRWLGSEAVTTMSLAAQGAYARLLSHQWKNGTLPADPVKLSRLIGASLEEAQPLLAELQAAFPKVAGQPGRIANPQLAAIRVEQDAKHMRRVNAGKSGGAKRWGHQGEGLAVVEGGQSDSNAIQVPSAPRESNAALLYRLLPVSHQTPEVRRGVGEYFAMRTAKRYGRLTDITIRARAREYGGYSVEILVQAFKDATLGEWRGVFPQNARLTGQGAKSAKGESASELEARVSRELDGDVADAEYTDGGDSDAA